MPYADPKRQLAYWRERHKKMRAIPRQPLTQRRLKFLLQYDPSTGNWRWRVSRNGRTKKGDLAGHVDALGYRVIHVDRWCMHASRLAWLYMKGYLPKRHIDHADTNPSNDKWDNLRLATNGQNIANSRLRKDSSSGMKGAYFRRGKWFSAIRHNKKLIHLGYFLTKQEAHSAYFSKAKELRGRFARAA
jgi:hypothetical protein